MPVFSEESNLKHDDSKSRDMASGAWLARMLSVMSYSYFFDKKNFDGDENAPTLLWRWKPSKQGFLRERHPLVPQLLSFCLFRSSSHQNIPAVWREYLVF